MCSIDCLESGGVPFPSLAAIQQAAQDSLIQLLLSEGVQALSGVRAPEREKGEVKDPTWKLQELLDKNDGQL